MRSFLLVTLGILILAFSNTAFAQMASTGNDIGSSRISPASPVYFLKTVRENLEMKLAFTQHVKWIRQLEFTTRRLRETKSLIGGKEDLIPPTLERYFSHINSLPQKDLEDEEVMIRVREGLTVHLEVLEQIYNKVINKNAKMSIRTTMNRLVQRIDVSSDAKNLACNFLAKEASSSALTEPEREILQQRVINCFTESDYKISGNI